ncbi:MAG: succinate dehydrogenase iron-sulfur subunit [Anaerolineaceae bacterium]|nr:succinate dehydrogenase iron-sulfur subunit [Anaerolineaceae bacterium]
MLIHLKVFRFDPQTEKAPHYDNFELQAEPTDRVLDLLEKVRNEHDASLGLRRSCAHGVCGSDAMRINGKNALACKKLVRDLNSDHITIEPLLGLKVIRDLIVDMKPFFEHYESLLPYLINEEPLPTDGKERIQTEEQVLRYEDTTKCILCAACTTSCPSFWADGKYIGPAAIVNAHRFVFDSRDRAAAKRLKILNQQFGVWRCRTAFNCTEACPREIKITQAIAEVKRAITTGKLD